MRLKFLGAILTVVLLTGCGIKKTYEVSGAEAKAFHDALSAQQYDEIWKEAAPDFRKSTEKKKFFAFMEAINRKLGKVKEAKQTGWKANNTNGVSTVTIIFDTTFERGKGTETITFLKPDGDRLDLLGYNINSTDMMIN